MDPHLLSSMAQLSNDELLARVKQLATREREITTALIVHLAELDTRRLYLAEGYPSLFVYCTQALHLSEHAAYGRIAAARAARRFSVILEMLCEGSVNLSTVCLLAPHLTPENHREVLDTARHQTKRQVEELVARLRPQPPIPPSVRRLPAATPASAPPATLQATGADLPATGDMQKAALPPLSSPAPVLHPKDRAVVAPLAPQRYKVQFTANAETYEKLRRAQELLRHQIPGGDVGQIMDRALTALLEDLARKRLAATDRPRASHGRVRGSRHVPAAVKRAVWLRDGGQCAFVGQHGRRCAEQSFLEFHHVVPHAVGGEPTVDNIQLRCRAHNGHEAERYFGRREPSAVKESRALYSVRAELSPTSAAESQEGSLPPCETLHGLFNAPIRAGVRQRRASVVAVVDSLDNPRSEYSLHTSTQRSHKNCPPSKALRALTAREASGTRAVSRMQCSRPTPQYTPRKCICPRRRSPGAFATPVR